ncbi:unnamed protein product [Strongylus vulgaris]|uniref:Reverse transcriptase domain-containing protein n=1 Tax=Strongylus vulgaris TaxID=40348 RepID=A0A3P7KR73_STRVU|nr:unnamed protein product [Strongylus vulgaris]
MPYCQRSSTIGWTHLVRTLADRPKLLCNGFSITPLTALPQLHIATLQWVMKSLDWNERGKRVDGRFLSYLRFADDIVLFSRNIIEAETMLKELNEVGNQKELRINWKELTS